MRRSFWRMSFELLRESLRWESLRCRIVEGAKWPFSRLGEALLAATTCQHVRA
jgi:hypothetical protein